MLNFRVYKAREKAQNINKSYRYVWKSLNNNSLEMYTVQLVLHLNPEWWKQKQVLHLIQIVLFSTVKCKYYKTSSRRTITCNNFNQHRHGKKCLSIKIIRTLCFVWDQILFKCDVFPLVSLNDPARIFTIEWKRDIFAENWYCKAILLHTGNL